MCEHRFTPAPWSPRFGEAYSIRDAEGGQLAILTNLRGAHGLGGRRSGEEVAANARLIAAAPELLEALQWAMGTGGLTYSHLVRGQNDNWCNSVDKARAAIAKALGEQP